MQLKNTSLVTAVAVALGTMGSVSTAMAQERAFQLPRIDVVGQTEAERARIPAAVNVLTQEDVDRIQPRSTEDLLRRVPGVYIKGEEESAVVTNFGVRGIPAGDFKTLVLEDGVPVQPGIFIGNSRYYNPRVQRMEGVEVLKGASSLRYGPNNIGGVINFQTRMPEDGVSVRGKVGSWNTQEVVAELGGSSPSGDSRFGIIATRAESDGWMDKGYTMTDVMVRAGTAIGEDQYISAKFVYYDNEANISYRGLFEDAYKAGKTFNPAPDDYYLTSRTSFDVNHEWQINRDAELRTLVYWSEMDRGYWRQNVDGTKQVDGVTVWDYGPDNRNAFRGAVREFERIGVDSRLTLNHETFGINNEAELGIRYMEEEMLDIDARNTPFALRYDTTHQAGDLRQDRTLSASNIGLFAQNRFDVTSDLSITAGLRTERYEVEREDRKEADNDGSFSDSHFLPGIGATYQLNPSAQLFGGIHRAMAPPQVANALDPDLVSDPEKSTNIEIGVRGVTGSMRYEVAVFNMDFSNYVEPGISAIADPKEGDARIRGVEGAVGYDFGNGFMLDGNLTWIPTAEFRSGIPEKDVDAGNRLSYSPEWMGNLTLAYHTGPLEAALLVNYTGEVYGEARNRKEIDPENHRDGLLSSYYTVDLTGQYAVNQQFSVFGAIKNLTDERYISGLRQGIYVGPERSFELGAKYRF